MAVVELDIDTDFTDGVLPCKFYDEIKADSTLGSLIVSVSADEDTCYCEFTRALTGPEQTQLETLAGAHDADPPEVLIATVLAAVVPDELDIAPTSWVDAGGIIVPAGVIGCDGSYVRAAGQYTGEGDLVLYDGDSQISGVHDMSDEASWTDFEFDSTQPIDLGRNLIIIRGRSASGDFSIRFTSLTVYDCIQ